LFNTFNSLAVRLNKSQGIRLRPVEKKSKAGWGVLFLMVLMVLFIGGRVFKGWFDGLSESRRMRELVVQRLDEVDKLVEVDRDKAGEVLDDIDSMVDELDDEALRGRWEELFKKNSGERGIDLVPWLDLGLFADGFTADMVGVGEGSLVAVDGDSGLVMVIDEDKSVEVLGRVDGVIDVALIGRDEVVVLVDGGLMIWNGSGFGAAGLNDVDYERIEAFGSNIYLLSSDDIYIMPAVDQGLGVARRYLAAGVLLKPGELRDLVIDGEVWIVKEDQVERLSRGEQIDYGLRDGLVNDIRSLATTDERLFILSGGEVVVVEKEEGLLVERLVGNGVDELIGVFWFDGRLLGLRNGVLVEVQ
jgi:hypothetical protein